jgi:integrase
MAVFKRKDRGTWQFVVDLPGAEGGKRRQVKRGGFKSRSLALAAEREFLGELDEGAGLDSTYERDSVAEYLERWLAIYAEPKVAPSTYKRYAELVRVHLIPRLGGIPLRKLQPLDIEACYNDVQRARSASTAHHVHRCLNTALRQAVKWRLIKANPVEGAEAPRFPKPLVRVPSEAEVKRLLAAGDATPFGVLYRIAFLTGMRQGELCALKWEFVDLEAGQITVRASAGRQKGKGIVMRQPKTAASVRTIAIGPAAVSLLEGHRSRQAADKAREPLDYQRSDLVFADALGRPLDGARVGRVWARIAEAGGLGRVRFHDLRHANATSLLRAGIPMKVVQARLGHSTIQITADTYSHVTADMDRRAADALDGL